MQSDHFGSRDGNTQMCRAPGDVDPANPVHRHGAVGPSDIACRFDVNRSGDPMLAVEPEGLCGSMGQDRVRPAVEYCEGGPLERVRTRAVEPEDTRGRSVPAARVAKTLDGRVGIPEAAHLEGGDDAVLRLAEGCQLARFDPPILRSPVSRLNGSRDPAWTPRSVRVRYRSAVAHAHRTGWWVGGRGRAGPLGPAPVAFRGCCPVQDT